MKHFTLAAVGLAGFACLGACSEDGPLDPDMDVEVSGYWINVEEPPSQRAGCELHFSTSQSGEATYLGAFTGAGFTCIPAPPQQLEEPPHFFYDPAPPYFVAAFENEMTWTTADGDELWLRPNVGVFVQSLETGQVSVVGTLRASGGTGRFADATGELEVRSVTEDGTRLEYSGTLHLSGA